MGALAASFLGDLAVGTGVGHRRTRPAPGRPGPSRVLAGNRWSWASGCVSNPLPNASSRVVICWLRLARTATVAWVMTPSAWLIGGAVASWAERIAVWIWAARCWRLRWRPPRRRAAASLARDSWRPSSGWGEGQDGQRVPRGQVGAEGVQGCRVKGPQRRPETVALALAAPDGRLMGPGEHPDGLSPSLSPATGRWLERSVRTRSASTMASPGPTWPPRSHGAPDTCWPPTS
jgi:hypothetical protein